MSTVDRHSIPYQLRPLKAIERNLFINILKKLDRYIEIDLNNYRYVGFGAPFLEDFKLMHLEFGMTEMDCIEVEAHAFSRQTFNNPYKFVTLYNTDSTKYITSNDFKQDKNQIVWLDYTTPSELAQQLLDIELASAKMRDLDIFKITFNVNKQHFIEQINSQRTDNRTPEVTVADNDKILRFLNTQATLKLYMPDGITPKDILSDFSVIVRAMALRAIQRGLAKTDKTIIFKHISSFRYADGQKMTTLTGFFCEPSKSEKILVDSGLNKWEFYQKEAIGEIIPSSEILVPVMTISERIEIDKLIPLTDINTLAAMLKFSYGKTPKDHLKLLEGYCRYYKYLPYYSRVTY
jgi:hypothetical protein